MAAGVAARHLHAFLGNILMCEFVLLRALDLPAVRLRWGHPLWRRSAVGIRLLEGWMSRTFRALLRKSSFQIAGPGPVIRRLRPRRALVVLMVVSMSIDFVILLIQLIIIASLLNVSWETPELLLILVPFLVLPRLLTRRSSLQLPADWLEGILLLLEDHFWREVHLVLSGGLALRRTRVSSAAVLIPSVDSHRTLIIDILVVVLLALGKIEIRNEHMNRK